MTFEGRITFWTAKAFRFWGNYWAGELWIPKSQARVIPDGEDSVVIITTNWYDNVKGLREFEELDEEEIARLNEQ